MSIDISLAEITASQKRTAELLKQIGWSQARSKNSLRAMRREISGMTEMVGYRLQNEAGSQLPKFLADHHQIRITSKVIRQQGGNEESNILAEGERGQTPVLIVGEAKSRPATQDIAQRERKVKQVEQHYPAAAGRELVPVLVAHFARQKELEKAARAGVIVVRRFEW